LGGEGLGGEGLGGEVLGERVTVGPEPIHVQCAGNHTQLPLWNAQ
jgi:hypothetical protein